MRLQVETIEDIVKAIERKKSLICQHWQKPLPAASVINMPAAIILKIIKDGLFVYNKKK